MFTSPENAILQAQSFYELTAYLSRYLDVPDVHQDNIAVSFVRDNKPDGKIDSLYIVVTTNSCYPLSHPPTDMQTLGKYTKFTHREGYSVTVPPELAKKSLLWNKYQEWGELSDRKLSVKNQLGKRATEFYSTDKQLQFLRETKEEIISKRDAEVRKIVDASLVELNKIEDKIQQIVDDNAELLSTYFVFSEEEELRLEELKGDLF